MQTMVDPMVIRSASPRARRSTARIALALIATVALTACAAATAPQLAGKEFVAAKVTDGGQDLPLVPGTKLRLSFSATDIGASAGCNHMGGTYRIDGGRLIVGNLGTTDMGCDPDLMAQDQWLGEILGAGPAVSLVVNDLVLHAGSVRITFVDREIAEPDAKLVGPTWTAVAGGIEVGPLTLTKMACEKDGAALESAVLGVLEAGTIGAQIDSSLMTLTAGNQGLMLRAS